MSLDIMSQFQYLPQQNLSFFAESPVVYHCHHFNLFLDQTIKDALGHEDSLRIRTKAAHSAAYNLLEGLSNKLGLHNAIERIQMATTVFSGMGHGSLSLLADMSGGTAEGHHLHYGFAWLQKYGQQVGRSVPADAFAAGFSAGAIEVAYNLPKGTLWAEETSCIATGGEKCAFSLTMKPHSESNRSAFRRENALLLNKSLPEGKFEAQVTAITDGLVDFLGTLSSDSRGLLEGFGVFIAMHLTEYYNCISYEALRLLKEKNPPVVGLLESLLSESGHVCVFNTFGGILNSPEWEGMVGPPGRSIDETILSCTAIARSLGFGHWSIHEFEPEKRLVLRSPGNYEAPYYVTNYGRSEQPRCYFFQGAALAFMQLAHQVDWNNSPEFTQDFYNQLFRSSISWKVEETQCMTMGHDFCEVVVTKK